MADPATIIADVCAELARGDITPTDMPGVLARRFRDDRWSLVRVADSWAGDNGGHCILADEVWRP